MCNYSQFPPVAADFRITVHLNSVASDSLSWLSIVFGSSYLDFTVSDIVVHSRPLGSNHRPTHLLPRAKTCWDSEIRVRKLKQSCGYLEKQ